MTRIPRRLLHRYMSSQGWPLRRMIAVLLFFCIPIGSTRAGERPGTKTPTGTPTHRSWALTVRQGANPSLQDYSASLRLSPNLTWTVSSRQDGAASLLSIAASDVTSGPEFTGSWETAPPDPAQGIVPTSPVGAVLVSYDRSLRALTIQTLQSLCVVRLGDSSDSEDDIEGGSLRVQIDIRLPNDTPLWNAEITTQTYRQAGILAFSEADALEEWYAALAGAAVFHPELRDVFELSTPKITAALEAAHVPSKKQLTYLSILRSLFAFRTQFSGAAIVGVRLEAVHGSQGKWRLQVANQPLVHLSGQQVAFTCLITPCAIDVLGE